jgi:DNA polymerase (family X)
LDNPAIAHLLGEIADLLEIKGDNPFKIRAYRNAADIVANHPHQLALLDVAGLREIPGIGKDLAARIREISETGGCAYHRELMAEFPPTILDLLHLQGVGPKTVATFYKELGVRTLEDLEQAAKSGRVRALKGMGAKKEALILKALDERKRFAGRHLLPDTHDVAAALVAYLRGAAPDATIEAVGSLRRGCESCGDIDILATVASTATLKGSRYKRQDGTEGDLMDALIEYPLVERVLGHGDTKSSVLLRGGFQTDLRLVPPESRGAAQQYFTGSKSHNIAIRDRAMGLGMKLNEYGLFRAEDNSRVAGTSEEELYAALGLAWIPPEMREARGEIERAASRTLPRLVDRADLLGDLHMHTTETDGKDDIASMVRAAAEAGHKYIAITDHSQSLAMANGLDETRALAHAARIRACDGLHGVRVLAGIECDIRPDGTLDLVDECLAALDIVVVSIHSAFNMDREQMTARMLRAIAHPHVDIVGHPTGRLILRREPYPLDMDAVVAAAARHGVALEINSQINRLDLSDVHATLARERGVPIVISSDAHSRGGLDVLKWGTMMARRAWLEPQHVLNTRPFDAFKAGLRRNRAQ